MKPFSHEAFSFERVEPAPTPNDIVTEDNAASRFVELRGGELRFCHSQHAWFRWNGCVWTQDKTGGALYWARELARNLAQDQNDRHRYITSKVSFASGVERFARHDPQIAVTADYWDSDPFLLGTPGGTVDLRTGELRPSVPDDGITKSTSVAPLDAPCARWLQFLNETTGNDRELIRFLQQWCGYSLTGSRASMRWCSFTGRAATASLCFSTWLRPS